MKTVRLGLSLLILAVQASWAQKTWDRGAGTDYWGDGANWDPDGMPASGTDIIIGTDGSKIDITGTARTVGTVIFNRDGDFMITNSVNFSKITVNGPISVTATGRYYISRFLGFPAAPKVVTVATNSTLDLNNTYDTSIRPGTGGHLTKQGPGSILFSSNGQLPTFDIVTIAEGAINCNDSSGMSGSGLIISNGAQWGGTYGFGQKTRTTNSLIRGNYAPTVGGFTKYNCMNATIDDEGVYNGVGSMLWYSGVLLLDNSVLNRTNRFRDASMLELYDRYVYRGSDSEDSSETHGVLRARLTSSITITNDGTRNATLTFSSLDTQATTENAGFIRFFGDMGGRHKVMFTTAPTLTDGILGFARVGDEFATYDATAGIKAYVNPSRPSTIANDGTANVELTASQTLGADSRVNSLKMNGPDIHLDLNGKTLIIDTGGLIVTGGGATVGTISNGTLVIGTASNVWLCIQAESDLSINTTIQANGASKIGAGKLTLSGDFRPRHQYPRLHWGGGDLEYNCSSNVSSLANTLSGVFTKNGTATNTFSSNGSYYSDGGMVLNAGRVQITGLLRVPGGTIQINTGAVYYLNGLDDNTIPRPSNLFVLNGGTLEMALDYRNRIGADSEVNVPAGVTGYVKSFGFSGGDVKQLYKFSGSGTLVKQGVGVLNCNTQAWDGGFTGNVAIEEGYVTLDSEKKWPTNLNTVCLLPAGKFWPSASLAFSNDNFSGNGLIMANSATNGTGTVRSFTSKGGSWWPGGTNSAGSLLVWGNLILGGMGPGQKATLEVDLGAAGNYDTLAVTGTVALSGVELKMNRLGSYRPAPTDTFTILANDAADAITGVFTNSVVGGRIQFPDESSAVITYAGGDGNDVVLSEVTFKFKTGSIFVIR